MATRWSSHHSLCSIRSRPPHVSSSANDFLRGARSRCPQHSHYSQANVYMVDRTVGRCFLFCSGRGENFATIARSGKPLLTEMHHRVHAVAGALQKPNVACPHSDVSTVLLTTEPDAHKHNPKPSVCIVVSVSSHLQFRATHTTGAIWRLVTNRDMRMLTWCMVAMV